MRISLFLFTFTAFLVAGPAGFAQPVVAEAPKQLSVVRVNVTNQPYDFSRPWGKRSPLTRRGVGAVLPGDRVLVTAEMVANANYVEFETPEGSEKIPAEVAAVDYESNLALLKASDPAFLKAYKPLDLTVSNVGDALAVWQLENNGNLLVTKGTMTTAEVTHYPADDSVYLVYRMTASVQFRDSSFTVPVVKEGKMVGLLSRYDSQSSNVEIIPTPVIEHFLRDASNPPYKGFPRVGMAFASTRDPQLRRYCGLQDQTGGVYVTDVLAGGPGGKAGLTGGDVLLRIDDQAVDQDGNYSDPIYGKISLSHLLSTRHYVGDVVKFTIFRKGETKDLQVTMTHRAPDQYVSDPYITDRPPKFYILGGLILQELSRQYLKEWGGDWMKKAPEDLVYLDRHQNELYPEGNRKIVFLSRVLPSDATVGYEELHHLVITKINGQEILRLSDVPAALEKAQGGVHKIEFSSDPSVIYLNASQITTSDPILAKTYRLPSLRSLE